MVISEGCSTTWATVCAGTIAVTAICPRCGAACTAGAIVDTASVEHIAATVIWRCMRKALLTIVRFT